MRKFHRLLATRPTITQLLTETFGVSFYKATTDQKLALLECSAFLMRQPSCSLQDALAAIEPEVMMPQAVALSKLQMENFREGLTLLALLYGGVNRDCSVFSPSEDQDHIENQPLT